MSLTYQGGSGASAVLCGSRYPIPQEGRGLAKRLETLALPCPGPESRRAGDYEGGSETRTRSNFGLGKPTEGRESMSHPPRTMVFLRLEEMRWRYLGKPNRLVPS